MRGLRRGTVGFEWIKEIKIYRSDRMMGKCADIRGFRGLFGIIEFNPFSGFLTISIKINKNSNAVAKFMELFELTFDSDRSCSLAEILKYVTVEFYYRFYIFF